MGRTKVIETRGRRFFPSRQDDFLGDNEALELIQPRVHDSLKAQHILPVLKRDYKGNVTRSGVRRFLEAYRGYLPLDFRQVKISLGDLGTRTTYGVLSSFPGDEIKDLALETCPYVRTYKSLYLIREGVDFETQVLPRLNNIKRRIREDRDFSYEDVSKSLITDRGMLGNHPLFDALVGSVFPRREEGTFPRDGVGVFMETTKGYGYHLLGKLFGDEAGKVSRLLLGYTGDLVFFVNLRHELVPSGLPSRLYLFKCDDDFNVDTARLRRELGG